RCKGEQRVRRIWKQRTRNEKRVKRSVGIRLVEIVEIETAEQEPVLRIFRFEPHGCFVAVARVECDGVSGPRSANAVVREKKCGGERKKKQGARAADRNFENHARQLCLTARQ